MRDWLANNTDAAQSAITDVHSRPILGWERPKLQSLHAVDILEPPFLDAQRYASPPTREHFRQGPPCLTKRLIGRLCLRRHVPPRYTVSVQRISGPDWQSP